VPEKLDLPLPGKRTCFKTIPKTSLFDDEYSQAETKALPTKGSFSIIFNKKPSPIMNCSFNPSKFQEKFMTIDS
jgi:hypothetical protein